MMDSGNNGEQNMPASDPDWEEKDPSAAATNTDMETVLTSWGQTPIALEDLRPDQLEEMRDFMTDFKFDWEEAASEKLADQQPRRKSARRHTLCDVTPARRTRPLSGKVLSQDFLDISNSSGSKPVVREDERISEGHHPEISEVISDIPCRLDDSPKVSPQAGVSFYGTLPEDGVEAAPVVVASPPPFLRPVLPTEGSSIKRRKKAGRKRRQSSALDRRRETLALLRTILSPRSGGTVPTPPSSVPVAQDRIEGIPAPVGVKPAAERKRGSEAVLRDQKKSSRRKSRRLSGISGPMLELSANGVPKLLKLEEVYRPQDCSNQSDTISTTQEERKLSTARQELSRDVRSSPCTLMETDESPSGTTSDVTTKDKSASLAYRVSCQSPMTPLDVTDTSSPRDSEYGTPRGLPVYQESPQTLCTPDRAVLCSFQQLKLQREGSEGLKVGAERAEITRTEEELSSGSLRDGAEGNSRPSTEVRVRESPMLTPDTTPEEFVTPMKNPLDEGATDATMEDGGCLGHLVANKENLSCCVSPEEDSPVENFDKKVKDLYLKKGQVGPKKGNTNLETVFEDTAKYDVVLGRRKFKRLLAFPEKPWEARKGTKGRKVERRGGGKRKKFSLSRTAKKNDMILQERLNYILNSMATDSS